MALTAEEQKIAERKTPSKRASQSNQQPTSQSNQQPIDNDQLNGQLTVLRNNQRSQLESMAGQLTQIADQRTNAIEQISDALAYLHSPESFYQDVITRTSDKMGNAQPMNLEAVANTFDLSGFMFPKVVNTAMGSFPI
jgi:hypothetical protein